MSKKRTFVFRTTEDFFKDMEKLVRIAHYRSKTEALHDAIRQMLKEYGILPNNLNRGRKK